MLSLPNSFELIAFKPSGREYAEPAQINFAEAPVAAHPVVAGDRVFIRDEDSLTLWIIE
jgi:outer membrane protein assembly factor BamB